MGSREDGRQRIEAFVDEIVGDLEASIAEEAREDFVEHLLQSAADLERQGHDPSRATEEAIQRFGTAQEVRARLESGANRPDPPLRPTSRPSVGEAVRSTLRDVRLAARTASRRPLVPALVVITIAIGIAATTTVYSVVEKVLVEKPPFPAAEELVVLTADDSGFGVTSPANYLDLRRDTERSLASLSAYSSTSTVVGYDGENERLDALLVSSEYFRTLAVPPAIGGTFGREHEADGSSVAVVSHDFWLRRLGGQDDPVGVTVTIDGTPTQVLGVMPEGFRLHDPVDVWLPLTLVEGSASRGSNFLFLVGRLAPGTSIESANSELEAVSARLHAEYPRFVGDGGMAVRSLHEALVMGVAPRLRLLSAAVLLMLLIVGANVGNLLLTRAEERRPEFTLRVSLGAARARVANLIAIDTLLLASVGAALGLVLAWQMVSMLSEIAPPGLPRAAELRVDLSVVAAGVVTALGTALLICFGVTSQVLRTSFAEAGAFDRFTGSPARRRVRDAIVVAQVAGSLVLLIYAGLLTRSFANLQGIDPGLNADQLLTAQVTLNGPRFDESGARWVYFDAAQDRLREIPGVESVAVGTFRPTSGGFTRRFALSDRPPPPDDAYIFATFDPVAPGYFETLEVPLLAGRTFEEQDATDSRPVAVVNRAFQEEFFPIVSPIGVWLGFYVNGEPRSDQLEIVGVVGDIRSDAISSEARPAIYLPMPLSPMSSGTFFVRQATDDPAIVAALRDAFREVDPTQPVHSVRPMAEVFASSIERDRLLTLMLALFAGVSFVLALTGVFGLTAHSVGSRTREFGLRIALGADPRAIVRATLRSGLKTVATGLFIGWVIADAAGGLIQDQLFQVERFDPVIYGSVTVLLTLISLLAVLLPARRASSIHPLEALRSE